MTLKKYVAKGPAHCAYNSLGISVIHTGYVMHMCCACHASGEEEGGAPEMLRSQRSTVPRTHRNTRPMSTGPSGRPGSGAVA